MSKRNNVLVYQEAIEAIHMIRETQIREGVSNISRDLYPFKAISGVIEDQSLSTDASLDMITEQRVKHRTYGLRGKEEQAVIMEEAEALLELKRAIAEANKEENPT